MLELVEPFIELSRRMRTRQDVRAGLEKTCETFGFRSAILMEYTPRLDAIVDYIDTDEARSLRWKKPQTTNSIRRVVDDSQHLIEQGRVVSFAASRFDSADPSRKMAEELDLLDCVSAPIVEDHDVAGAIFFSGLPPLSPKRETGLHAISYLLFASLRTVRQHDDPGHRASLTPREKEVMIQSSLGYTSPEIAGMLGLAERTVNQHIENVAYKFGTKNRIHTVANLLRLHLLD
ncbi:MAG: helix-turn-helix transcriptional regulator [Candidatus Devosia phytovorans]|uniref:Helix-turn-helix transcriptional regulator n=1 Tax=Candidatus Devosia phytovorans TaxID=3121372 RepID=A0AAJ6B2D4_9HYPH|nr:helix-turn-helix transcriptional regulator [Devosia sp.]WEK06309.1 MAG: helix-turn-helix transcriptional regulator [Devosia sp.]